MEVLPYIPRAGPWAWVAGYHKSRQRAIPNGADPWLHRKPAVDLSMWTRCRVLTLPRGPEARELRASTPYAGRLTRAKRYEQTDHRRSRTLA